MAKNAAPQVPTFAPVEKPQVTRVGRPKEANPYTDAVASLIGTDNALAFDAPIVGERDQEQSTAYAVRLLRNAGADLDVTVRTVVEGSHITFWTTKRVLRPRKNGSAENAE